MCKETVKDLKDSLWRPQGRLERSKLMAMRRRDNIPVPEENKETIIKRDSNLILYINLYQHLTPSLKIKIFVICFAHLCYFQVSYSVFKVCTVREMRVIETTMESCIQ